MQGYAFDMHLHIFYLIKYIAIAILLNLCTNVAHAHRMVDSPQDNNVPIANNLCENIYNYRCFNNNVTPTINFQHTAIGLQVSNRATHQLMSRIFAIILREFLQYENITFIKENYNGSCTNFYYEREKLAYTLQQLNYQPTMPNINMINLEVWMPALGHNLLPMTAYEATSSLNAGRFGWFVPKFNTDTDQAYNHLHYTMFQSNTTAMYQRFLIPHIVMLELMKDSHQHEKDNWFVSPLCKNLQSCVILLAEHKSDTYFVTDQIIETNSYLNILWLGNSFQEKVHYLYNLYNKSTIVKNFIVLHWQPSALINVEIDFHNIIMPNCEEFPFLQRSLCKYEQTPILKYFFKRLQTSEHEQLLVALRRFKLNNNNLQQLMQNLAETQQQNHIKSECAIYNEIACSWLKNNTIIFKNWLTTSYVKKTFYIGGIFPLTCHKDYNHHNNVIYAVRQAVQDINKNNTILRNYNLAVYEIDGKCQTDVVLQAFIHYFNQANLIGILGPTYSSTIMPIAGISKHTNMPLISYAATGGYFNDRESYPYIFRTIGSEQHIIHVYSMLFERYAWQRVGALGQEDHTFLDHIETEFNKHNIELWFITKFSLDVRAEEVKKNLLNLKQKRCKIIIVDMNSRNALLTFCQAYKLQMTSSNGYVWFMSERISYDLNELQLEELNCTAYELQKAMENHLFIKYRSFGEANAIVFDNVTIQQWINNFPRKYLSDFVGFAYDAVWAYALAADKLFKENQLAWNNMRSNHVVKRYVELLWQTDFTGLTGRVRFGQDGSRIIELDIMQYRNGKFLKVGKYTPIILENVTLYTKNGVLNMHIWEQDAPDDGTFDCNFSFLAKMFSIDCENVTNFIIILFCLIFMFCGFGISFVFWKSRFSKKLKRSARIMRSYGIDLTPLKTNKNTLDKWEISKDNLILNRRLGEGAFGTVYGGEARIGSEKWNAVAVKSLKLGACDDDRKDFLSEAQAMKRFNHHNIIKLLGVCLQSEPIYTIMEFMLYGDLKTFLLARRHLVNEKVSEDSDISPKRLSMYALDVARGLAYLSEQRYIHRDLACRNCLVNADRTVKICDFGMARATYESDYYRFNRKGKLPVRWMAPEALALGMFTTASDIWSYGVVLYEIISFGAYPYQGMTNGQVLEYVKSGRTLVLPKGIKPQLEELIKACWSPEPKDRPLASDILEFISSYPRLLVPCLDFPGASLMFSEESSELELELDLLSKMYNNPKKVNNDYDIALSFPNNNQITEAAKKRMEELLFEIDMRNRYTEMYIPDYMNSDGTTTTASTTTATTPTTPDGYSIMSPLLMTNQSNSIDSSYA